MARTSYYVTRIQADVMHRRDDLLSAYELSPDQSRYWAFIDLTNSSNYRLAQGAKEGYVRAEEFYTLVYSTIAPYGDIQPLKELGDGVLLASHELRPMFEASTLVAQGAAGLEAVSAHDTFPFGVRIAIGYGPCKQLRNRLAADYIGSPIDTVARLSGAAEPNQILIMEHAFGPNRQALDDYASFARFGEIKQLTAQQSKNMLQPVRYRAVEIDQKAFNVFEAEFGPWRQLTERGTGSE